MSPRLKTFLHHLYHYGVYALGGAVIVVCVAALGFKFWVMPNIDLLKPELEAAATRALGKPVTLGSLTAGWAGINPRLTLRNLRVAADSGAPLNLPSVEAQISWLSLALLEPRLASLTLEQPQLAIRRDKAGVIHVAGIAVNVPTAPSPFPDWLIRQPRIIVRDASVTWLDEKLAAPEMRFDKVRLYIRNRFGHHRFGGVALPSNAAGRLDLRGNLTGGSVQQPETWSGQIYARVDDARFDTWGQWVPWAQEAVRRGTGSLRFWLDLEKGQARGLIGDTRLQGVAINISDSEEALPDLAFQSLAGRVGWARVFDRQGLVTSQSFFVEHLRFAVAGETPSEPASVRVSLTPDGRGGFKTVTASADNLRLEALTALTGALPLPRRGHDLIAVLNPRGLVEAASGHWGGARDYGFKLHVRGVGMNAYGNLPGISGLSAKIEADQASGMAEVQGRDLVMNLDRVFRHPLEFKQLDARATWKIADKATRLVIEEASFSNNDLSGGAEGRIDLPVGATPRLDLRAHLSHGAATAVYRYLPHAVGSDAYEWVKRGVIGGHSDDTRLILKGDLANFPFDKGGGEFKVSVKMVNGVLDYAEGWPRIDGVNGMLVFHDKGMTLNAHNGRLLNARLGPVRAHIDDLHASWDEMLHIDGRAIGATQTFLDFIRQSPVNEHTGGFTEKLRADGNGELGLNLHLPLRHIKDSTLGGAFTLKDNRIDLGEDLPDLEQLSGRLSFTESSVQARGIQTRVLGLPATLSFDNQQGGEVRAQLNGRATADALKPYLPASLASRISGAGDWQANIHLAKQQNEIQVSSDLVGLALALPSPFRKNAAQAVPLAITRVPGALRDSVVKVRYGNLISVHAEIPVAGVPRIALRLSQGDAPAPREEGISISGALRTLDLDAWRALDLGEAATNSPALREVNLTVNELKAAGHVLHDTHVSALPAGRGWKVTLAGRELDGNVLALPEGKSTRVIANFKRLTIPEQAPDALPGEEVGAAAQALAALELNARNFAWKGKDLGELHLRLSPEKGGYNLDRFSLALPEGKLEGKGLLSNQVRRPTRLNLDLETANLGKLLARVGYPGSVKGGEGGIGGTLSWLGGVENFALDGLSGDFAIAVKKGQFLKVEPGVAKLLGIVSLQALPRRITLDFRDVFSDGFAFDEIVGDVHLDRGSGYTRDLKMNGPAAKVRMSGVVNLVGESQNLRVSIQPRLEDTLALAGAILGGPVVGIGAMIANKVLKNPIGQAASFEYSVTGTWGEPVITKLKRQPQETAPAP
ncbi:MAG: YhdP family protein [Pseudomonadota bacterium]|nr:YhdP family protein [Pseudomonadota bacterium]